MGNDDDDTYTPAEERSGVGKAAQVAAEAVKTEVSAVVGAAAEHPHTVSAVGVLLGALAFTIGYVVGRNSVDTRRGSRW
ncbi:hypothetical protein LAC81_35875 (plasmid) [Ensifer adhaerens]|uniref:hypothetical protein n=1 Tax=Ensifer adhaerens TaxID=106592 RepID=UPI001CC07C3F|nr:hypothetical protein [Ensifer adhaerens]MBZ7927322.1 hypothetical protein [Ensifer adhaerens]UAX98333.1 hypothetical protein LAC78_37180 [Ensifer adhaerens]UAY05716.1 hypothetical protein LAC80_35885 [Ensifer adhaerens]UAY13093.1 hypothetical protein LAC81_35875 [Ensifer adhaerens]